MNSSPTTNSKQLLTWLLKLQSLESGEAAQNAILEKKTNKQVAELRALIPVPILNHYDRLRARGKKGVAPVRGQTCAGCHVQVTRATVMNLMHGNDIQVCENCGRYLCLEEPEKPAPLKRQKLLERARHTA